MFATTPRIKEGLKLEGKQGGEPNVREKELQPGKQLVRKKDAFIHRSDKGTGQKQDIK